MVDSSILGRFDPKSVGKSVASLISAEETDPDPRGLSRSSTQMYSADVDITRPDPQIEDYVIEYRNNPLISKSITNFADEVWEPGWWIEADSEKTVDELTEFCHNIGVKGGRAHRSLSELGKQSVIQNQVRGTFVGEKVTDDKGRHVALNPLNPSTFEVYTKPGTSMLVPPDYTTDNSDSTNLKSTPDDEAAAFVQFDQKLSQWEDRTERRFTRDKIMHWPRQPDVGDIFGKSAIEPIYERSIAMREKLNDNDLAIAMKAWPMVLFQLGSEDHPWTRDEMDDFMADYKEGELGPGMYQGVPGDVEVHEFAGETADIEGHVTTDVELIVSAMPTPKYALGAFDHISGGKSMAEIHERQFRKQVRAARRDLESIFTAYLKEVAESWGYDTSGLELNIGRPDGEVAPEDVQGSVIRYQSDAGSSGDVNNQQGGPSVPDPEMQEGQGDGNSENSSSSASGDDIVTVSTESESTRVSTGDRLEYDPTALADPDADLPVLDDDAGVAELSDPRLVSTRMKERSLGGEFAELIQDARDMMLEVIEIRYDGKLPDGRNVATEFRATVGSELHDGSLSEEVSDVLTEVLEDTASTLSDSYHKPGIEVTPRPEHLSLRDEVKSSVVRDLDVLTDEIATEIERQVNDISQSERGPEAVAERVRDVYDDGTLEHRTRLVARMRIQELINRMKLEEYRNDSDVVGVRIISTCSEGTSQITSDLAGCGSKEAPVALFDDIRSIGEQLEAATSADPPVGFDPLAGVPPYHYGDVSEIAPVTREQLSE